MRYSRQVRLEEVGESGQERLRRSQVLIIGMGGLGAPVGTYLAAAGVGVLGLVDFDRVDLSNLQRQVLFSSDDLGKSKVAVAADRLRGLNPDVRIEEFDIALSAENVEALFARYDLVMDCSDNFSTKYLINDGALKTSTPWIMGAVDRFEAQIAMFSGKLGQSCYRCLIPRLPQTAIRNCSDSGVLGPWVGVVGSLQASFAVQFLLSPHLGSTGFGKLVSLDGRLGLKTRQHEIAMRTSGCTCGMNARDIPLCSGEGVCVTANLETLEIDVDEFRKELQKGKLGVLDVRTEVEWAEDGIEGSRCFSLELLMKGDLPSFLKDYQRWVVCCRSGKRSKTAARLLNSLVMGHFVSLKGGVSAISSHDSILRKGNSR